MKYRSEWIAVWALVAVVVSCVVAGLFLDRAAAQHDLTMFHQEGITEKYTDPATGKEIMKTRGLLSQAQGDAILALQRQRSDRLHESATLLYDFSKLALGALIALLTQVFSAKRPEPT